MKRLLMVALLMLGAVSAKAATGLAEDLFPFENYHSSFTKVIPNDRNVRFSVQVVASTPIVVDAPIMPGSINGLNDTITLGVTGYATGMPVLLSTAGASAPAPLVTGTTYFAVKVTDNLIKLATTYAQAVTGDTIDISTTIPAAQWTLRPLAQNLGVTGYLWNASNDGVNWTAVAASGYSIAGSTQALTTINSGVRLFDWSEYPYRFLQFVFNGPASQVVKLRALIFRKE